MTSPRLPYPELKSNRLGLPDSSTPVMGSSRLAEGIDQKILEFDVDVLDAVFNKPGRYFIKMTIQSLATKDYSKILLRKYPEERFTRDYEALTSVVHEKGTENEPELCVFDDKKFTFRLPAGFCKNDRNHDVYLLMEAFNLPTNNTDMGKKVGVGKVAIYPRTNAPRTNHLVNPGEDMYKEFDDEAERRKKREEERRKQEEEERRRLAEEERRRREEEEREEQRRREEEERRRKEELERKLQSENPFQPSHKVVRTPGPYDRRPRQPVKAVTPMSDNVSINLPPTPSPSPPPLELRKSVDSPLKDQDTSTFSAQHTWRHTARPGKEQIDVIIHGASSLPAASGGKMPRPFATVKTRRETEGNQKTKTRTHAVVKPTYAPSWEEMVTMEMTDKDSGKETLALTVNDAITKDELIRYSIPVSQLHPFHQYHVEMVMPTKQNPEGVKMYASITRKLSSLPKDPSSPNYLALEVFLRGVKIPFHNPVGPLIAVARIVPDYYNYKSDNLLSNPRAAGVTMSNVTFPHPPPNTFTVVGRSSHGYPQLSLLGRPEEQPRWKHPYLFCDEKDKGTMFTPSAALVIEYYVANQAMTDEFWKIKSPVGFSSLLLDQKVYKQLSQEKAKMGLRVENVPIMGSELRCVDSSVPVIGLVLKLVTTHQPDSLVTMSNLDNLPAMEMKEGMGTAAPHTPDVLLIRTPSPDPDPEPEEEEEEEEDEDGMTPGMYLQRVDKDRSPIKDGELPPYDAVESILPEYQYIFVDQNQDTARSNKPKPDPPSRHQRGAYLTGTTMRTRDHHNDLEQTHMNVLDQQMRELENYRTAVQRMGQDIIGLRSQVRTLEGDNSKMRIESNRYEDNKKLLIDASDLDSLARPELQARYVSLRQKLATQTSELKDYKAKVQKLQNELIKKNDKEKDYLKMTHAHASQQELLQRLQDKVQKVRKLEETVKKQERVIEKLEGVLYKMRGKPTKGDSGANTSHLNDANSALSEENRRLRQQIDDLKDQLGRAGMGGGEDMEKLELYQALERAEGRIMSLERQLQDNARDWGKEKANLSIKVNEAEHGFGRSGGMVLHDYPVLDNVYNQPFGAPSRLGPLLR